MSEIEKIYMRCKIKKQQTCRHSDTCYNGSLNKCEGCNSYQYPQFTPQKQLELICWLVNNKDSIMITNKPKPLNLEVLKESIAYGINLLWQDLTEQERTEIKRILE